MSDNFPAVEPHGSLQPIFADAWFLTGSVVFKPMIRLSRNMVVLRHGGELTLVNAIRLDSDGEAALDALGKVAHVIRIGVHGMDDGYYVDRYKATYWSIPGRERDDGLKTDRVLAADTELPLPDASVFWFEHVKVPEVAILIDRDGGLLITCDSVQHWAPSDLMSFGARIVTSVMGFKKPAQIGPPWRKMQTPEGGSLKPDFERLAALPFNKLIGGHGGLLESDAPARLKESIARELN